VELDRLVALLEGAPGRVFIQPHNVPDPDAIASAAGLRRLFAERGIEASIVYDRDIEKVDLKKMLEVFGIEMTKAGDIPSFDGEDWSVLVDGQRGTGNVTDLAAREIAVIDHHERRAGADYEFADIRPELGSCSTMIAEYFFENSIEAPTEIATALLYGIMKDTDCLSRGATELDVEMWYRLHKKADLALIRIVNGCQLTLDDLARYADAFRTVEVRGRIGFMRLESPDDSLLGASSDIVVSLDSIDALVAYAIRPSGVKISTRSKTPGLKANDLVRFLAAGLGSGGGHEHMAGGFLPADGMPPGDIGAYLKRRAELFTGLAG
jgi:nanoRNase/pAp phosphatase (c-di-AMP/oligoRNAs hydrolase)